LAQYISRFNNEKKYGEILPNQIQHFKSVFKGREDVFPIRWEKESKSGYMPAYFYIHFLLFRVYNSVPALQTLYFPDPATCF